MILLNYSYVQIVCIKFNSRTRVFLYIYKLLVEKYHMQILKLHYYLLPNIRRTSFQDHCIREFDRIQLYVKFVPVIF